MKIKKRNLAFAAIALCIVLAAFYIWFNSNKNNEIPSSSNNSEEILWSVDTGGYLYYPLERGEVDFYRENYSETENLHISKIVFKSRGASIYGLLAIPKETETLLPGMVLLPGAGVSKESELGLAKKISSLGIAVLVIDQRGVGETGGNVPSLQEDFISFSQKTEPVQHLYVFDALRSFDLLKSAPFVDKSRITIAGESLGGRIALIATSIDRNVLGAMAISAAPLKLRLTNQTLQDAFAKSLDSEHYVASITPRKLLMIHNEFDKGVPVQSAVQTFLKAQDPKRFVLINDTSSDCRHGYCDKMYNGMLKGMEFLYDAKFNLSSFNVTNAFVP